jgi:hypothetical protein
MAETLRADDFAPFVGKTFQPHGIPHALTLVKVETHDYAGWEAAPHKPFSLLLQGPPREVVPEGLYRFIVDGEREFELYLVPIHTVSRDHQDYQIVFN